MVRGPREAVEDRGSAVVEFVLVAPLLLLLALAVVQVALLLHARATLTFAAAEGARAGALAGNDPAAGTRRAMLVLDQNLGDAVIRDVTAERDLVDGLPVITVHIEVDMPLMGLLGATEMSVEGHALVEEPR